MDIVLEFVLSKRITKDMGLYPRKYKSDILQQALFMFEQCEVHGQMHGYCRMHLKCL